MEWLPVSGYVKKFFVHLLYVLNAYFSHAYETKLSHRVKKREQQSFLYDTKINSSCPEEYKNAPLDKCVCFSTLNVYHDNDLTYSFTERHQCEVRYLMCKSKKFSIDSIV